MESEWRWFRASLADALVRPRHFAASLAREHYGLAGVLVAPAAGVALSITVDVAVILSKGADPLAFLPRLLVDAVLLGARLVVVTALLALLIVGVARLARRAITIDQAFTALSFATSPLLAAPLVILVMVVALDVGGQARGPILFVALAAAALLALRLAGGVALNLSALAGRATPVVAAVALVAGALALQDQVGRVAFTTLSYAPQILPPAAEILTEGREVRLEGMRLTVPTDWKDASRGVSGVIGQYELPDARLIVRMKSVAVLTTADSFAAGEVQAGVRDFTRVDRTQRGIVRMDESAAIDDRWYGAIDDQRLVERLYTIVRGGRGYSFEFQFYAPKDEEAALEQAARIAASVRFGP